MRLMVIENIKTKLLVHRFMSQIKKYCDYDKATESSKQYSFSKERDYSHFDRFDLIKQAGNGTVMEKTCRILEWVVSYTTYNGASPLRPVNSDKIIQYVEAESREINCANRAILFCDALLSIGIFAIPIWLHNTYIDKKNQPDKHCHVIAEVWLEEEEMWATFDPSFNTYFVIDGKRANIFEMIESVRDGKKFKSITNDLKKIVNRGIDCTKIGLMDISFFSGCDDNYEMQDCKYHYVPNQYVTWLCDMGVSEKSSWTKRGNIHYILAKPHWTD